MPLKKPSEGTPAIDAGTYIVKLLDLYDGDEGQYGPMMKWDFEVYELDGTPTTSNFGDSPAEITEISSESMAPSAKARGWVEAFLGKSVEDMDPEEIANSVIGKFATAAITVNDGGFSKVSSLTPAPKKGRKAQPVAALGEEDDGDAPF